MVSDRKAHRSFKVQEDPWAAVVRNLEVLELECIGRIWGCKEGGSGQTEDKRNKDQGGEIRETCTLSRKMRKGLFEALKGEVKKAYFSRKDTDFVRSSATQPWCLYSVDCMSDLLSLSIGDPWHNNLHLKPNLPQVI